MRKLLDALVAIGVVLPIVLFWLLVTFGPMLIILHFVVKYW